MRIVRTIAPAGEAVLKRDTGPQFGESHWIRAITSSARPLSQSTAPPSGPPRLSPLLLSWELEHGTHNSNPNAVFYPGCTEETYNSGTPKADFPEPTTTQPLNPLPHFSFRAWALGNTPQHMAPTSTQAFCAPVGFNRLVQLDKAVTYCRVLSGEWGNGL